MKRKVEIEIGEGLFSNQPVPVEIEFADHTATFYMTALTQGDVAELEKQGVKWDVESVDKMLNSSRRLFARIIHGWDGLKANGADVPYSEENRDRIAEVPEVASELIQIAMQLAAHRQEVEEGNLESSSGGTSDPATS